MLWSEFRDEIRSTILNDTVSSRYKWTDSELLSYLRWSLSALCEHTALATATSFVSDGTTTTYSLPDNFFERIDESGAVYINNGESRTYLNPVRITQLQQASSGYYLSPETILHLVETPTIDNTIEVYYFSYYTVPVVDSSVLDFPTWARAALAYRIGAYAMTKYATKYATINQWNTKDSKGNPEDSSMGERAIFYFSQWEAELTRRPQQRRENFFRET